MKLVVFGGSGFLGSHVADKLSEAGHQVTIADLRLSNWLRPDQAMLTGSILDLAFVTRVCAGADIVLNFAGIADLSDADAAPADTARINVMGNVNILEACRHLGVERYIFASSLYVYGKHGGFYRCSKQACELYIDAYQQSYGIKYAILRYGSLYGPRADPRNGIYRFIEQAMNEGRIIYYGSRKALREYIHVEDAALCTLDIVQNGFSNDNIVLTGSQQMCVADLFAMIGEMLGKKLDIHYEDYPENTHYEVTPYSFMPKVGRKMFPRLAIDIGQGMLNVMNDVHQNKTNP